MSITLKPAQVASELNISSSTLRKYCLLIESEGYTFKRDAKNSRQFEETDVMTLRNLITLIKTDGVTLENAAYSVTRGDKGVTIETDHSTVMDNGVERHDSDITPLLISEIRDLKKEIQQQREVIDGFRKAQDKRDTYFLEVLENLQAQVDKVDQLIELQPPAEPEQTEFTKKGLFSRIFKK